jgi:hypothetical protein
MTEQITITKDTNIHGIIDELTYRCYRYNRQRTPDITPNQWSTTLPNVEAMEKRFQSEVKI